MRTDTLDIPALAAEFTAAHPELDSSRSRWEATSSGGSSVRSASSRVPNASPSPRRRKMASAKRCCAVSTLKLG